ncbi:MAG TPA: thioredoxin domain-containing protein, partial [Aggregatilineales bacterium]|nr:thioredoxin domain-containing protein [Aggregatilineales bacterium]
LPPEMTVDDDHFIGMENAPVKVVEFSDYRCGFCRRFYETTLKPLTDHYGDLIQFVYRDFPIFGEESINGAMAAECSGDQGKFWEYHNALFDEVALENARPLNRETLQEIAGSLELDVDTWSVCFDGEEVYNEVVIDAVTAQQWGVTGTPTFFINGKALVGAQPIEVFIQLIDAELMAQGIEPPAQE